MRCHRVDKSCFACLSEGECSALSDTDWGGKSCPFYKPAPYDYDTELAFDKYIGRFKRVRGFGDKYYVSEYGQVINSVFQNINVYYNERGFPYCNLYHYGTTVRMYLAAIVADAWVGGRGKIDFKDHNPANCVADNIIRRLPCRPKG